MFVRVFNKRNDFYYKSIVYAIVNDGVFSQYIVLNPANNCFELHNRFDRGGKLYDKQSVEIIQNNHEEFVEYRNARLLKYKRYCKQNGKEMEIHSIWGYPDVCENFAFITAILEDKSVPAANYSVALRSVSDEEAWNYVRTQEDADLLMKEFYFFHDSKLTKLFYEEEYKKITAVFDNYGWTQTVELCFEGVYTLRICPRTGKYIDDISSIYDATLLVRQETVFWADSYMENENFDYEGSYIKALNLKWRTI